MTRSLSSPLCVRPGNESSPYKWFRLYVARDGEHFTVIRFRPDTSTVKVDRTHSGFPHDIVNVREFQVNAPNGVLELRIVMDRYSLELFVNGGEQAASCTLYTPESADAISFASDGMVLLDVEKYDLVWE